MKRSLALLVAGGMASALTACYGPTYIPEKPTPAAIVRDNAAAEIAKAFAGRDELKAKLATFLEKLGEATTTVELRAAWKEVYPDHERVVHRAISKSIHDFYWPVAPVTDGRIFVEGFRAGAEQVVES